MNRGRRAAIYAALRRREWQLVPIAWHPRGVGLGWVPNCFVCGAERPKHNCMPDCSGFVASKEDGERLVWLFGYGAELDYRDFEPSWIQVKVGACAEHKGSLYALAALATDAGGFLDPTQIAKARWLASKIAAKVQFPRLADTR